MILKALQSYEDASSSYPVAIDEEQEIAVDPLCPDCHEILTKSYDWDTVKYNCDNCGNLMYGQQVIGADWT